MTSDNTLLYFFSSSYEMFLFLGFAGMVALPLLMHAFRKPEWKKI